MRLEPKAFSRDGAEYSDIPLSCEMKDEPAFKPLQGNRLSFESGNLGIQCTRGSKFRVPHIPIAEGRVLLRCLGKVAYVFNIILEIRSLLEMIWGAWSFPRDPVLKLVFL